MAAALLALLIAFTVSSVPASAATGTTYYVDATDGDDAADGMSPASAWKSLARVNSTSFDPGDAILLQADEAWHGEQFAPQGSGTAEQPIVIGSYGTGAKPAIHADGAHADAVRLFNQQHWVVSNVEITNRTTSDAPTGVDLRDLRGIHVSGDNGTTLSGFVIRDVDVHDVTGEVNWIGGSTANNKPGITFATGWDGSKKTGGIVFDTTVADILAPQSTPTVLNAVLIEGSTIVNTSFAGIVFKQYTGDGKDAAGNAVAVPTGWGTREGRSDPAFAPHTDITIRDNYVYQDGTEFGCNGMYLTNIRGAVVEHNVVERAGTVGIETYFADDVTIQHNEVFDTQRKAGGADAAGIDPDKGTTNQVIQYNYLHGNGDGVLICQFAFGDVVVRHNVITESSRYPVYLHSDRGTTAHIYRNTIHNSSSNYLVYGYGSSLAGTYSLTSNVFVTERAYATLTTSPTITYANNLYSGELTVPDSDTSAVIGDPMFVDPVFDVPGGGPATGPLLDVAHGFAVQSGSPAVNTGAVIDGASPVDFAGATLPVGDPDIGAFEYRTPVDATTEVVSGYVSDGHGRPLADAAVTVTGQDGVVHDGSSGASGWFRVAGVPLGDVVVEATRVGYEGAPVSASTNGGTSALVGVVLQSTSTVGNLAGIVLDVTGAPLERARVASVIDGVDHSSVETGVDGSYLLSDLPIGDGYGVRAKLGDLRTDVEAGLRVDPSATTQVRPLLLQPQETTVLFEDSVDARPLGPVADGTDGYTVSQRGGAVTVDEADPGRAFTVARTVNSGTTELARTFADPLTGIVTIQARTLRVADTGSNNWFSAPYIKDANGTNMVSVAFNRGNIVAYQGTSSSSLMRYELGRWYDITIVVDTVNQYFDLSIDGEKLIDHGDFRAPMVGGIGTIQFNATSSNLSTVRIDDLVVKQGSERDRSDAGLAALTTDVGAAVDVGDGWRLDVGAAYSTLDIAAVPSSPTAQGVEISGTAVPAGVPVSVALAEGANEVSITVIAEDGTRREHLLHVERALLAADASLASLTVVDGELAPEFDPGVDTYRLTTSASALTVTASALDPNAAVRLDGVRVAPDEPVEIDAVDGREIPITVESADGTATVTYTLTIVSVAPDVPLSTSVMLRCVGPHVMLAAELTNTGDLPFRLGVESAFGSRVLGVAQPGVAKVVMINTRQASVAAGEWVATVESDTLGSVAVSGAHDALTCD